MRRYKRENLNRYLFIIIFLIQFSYSGIFGQPGLSFELKKPPKYESKILGSEKTGNKKFTVPRRFIQNTFTHYNYYFNAYNRLNEVVARAKTVHRDDYTQLLPFYNYSLKATSTYKTDLDSVIYKSTTGVLIHDLRNDWIDNLYLLIGKAYYLRNDLDSAYLTFQYVNYAFSPKEKDGYDKVIGSNADEKTNAFSISTRENPNIVKKAFSRPPSRNESLVWQIKTYLAKDEMAEAAGLIQTLKNDPLFPERLDHQLKEVQALWFYNQQIYDSAAFYLEQVVDNAENNQEQARWEYLIAQLHERNGSPDLAQKFYNRAIRHTIDPVLEVYALLNSIRQDKNNESSIRHAIEELIKMARKDRYLQYRDIIYYTAAVIDRERNNPEGAIALLLKSIQSSTNNTVQKSKSFRLLGDITFEQKKYREAKNFYDSADIRSIPPSDQKMFTERLSALEKIVLHTGIISRQDSLQRIAAMGAEEREAFIKSLVKKLRKQQGIGDEADAGVNSSIIGNNNAPVDLFGSQAGKGDWYFYNATLKSKGFNEFKVTWGNRPNSDNWRRITAITRPSVSPGQLPPGFNPGNPVAQAAPLILTYEALLDKVPLTPEKLKISDDSTEHALFAAGKSYMDGLEDYTSAITAFEMLLSDYPATLHAEEAWFNLFYCYRKTGNASSQAAIMQALKTKFPNGKFTALLRNPNQAQSPDSVLKTKATLKYQEIYNQFIEGNFKQAIVQKKQADSVYGPNYWTPQLLYIEAVYYIRERQDSIAKQILSNSLQLYPNSLMNLKTANLLSVLSRRKQIEEYLTKLEIERPEDDNPVFISSAPLKNKEVIQAPKQEIAVASDKKITLPPEKKAEIPIVQPDTVNKAVEPGKEANAASIKFTNKPTEKPKINIDVSKRRPDSLQIITKPVVTNLAYTNDASQPHYVVLVLDRVDPVYATEARNAFSRYHRERYSTKNIEISALTLNNEIRFVLLKNFENASVALDYIIKTRKLTQSDIIPWLTAEKYYIMMITESNLDLLKTKKDISLYKKFLTEAYPGQF